MVQLGPLARPIAGKPTPTGTVVFLTKRNLCGSRLAGDGLRSRPL